MAPTFTTVAAGSAPRWRSPRPVTWVVMTSIELYGITLASGLDADVTLLGGVQPEQILDADIYRRLAGDLGANGRTVIADLTGAPLAAALAGGLAVLKLSHEELSPRTGPRAMTWTTSSKACER